MHFLNTAYAHGGEFVCRPGLAGEIAMARESVQTRVDQIFSEISGLQNEDDFLDNVAGIQERKAEIDRLRVQRDQIASVEACAKDCSCEEGAHAVLDEYNAFTAARGEEEGLVPVNISTAGEPVSLVGWGVAILIVAYGVWYLTFKRMRKT